MLRSAGCVSNLKEQGGQEREVKSAKSGFNSCRFILLVGWFGAYLRAGLKLVFAFNATHVTKVLVVWAFVVVVFVRPRLLALEGTYFKIYPTCIHGLLSRGSCWKSVKSAFTPEGFYVS